MSKVKKIMAVLLSVVMVACIFAVNVGAEAIGTNAKSISSGKQYKVKLANGGEYADYKIVSNGIGELTLKVKFEEHYTYVYVNGEDGASISRIDCNSTSGSSYSNSRYDWAESTELYAGVIKFSIKKGTYYIRFLRDNGWYSTGSGNITFTATFPSSSSKNQTSTVYDDDDAITTVKKNILKYFAIQLPEGDSLKFGIVADNSINGTVKWSSSDKSVAKVSSKGRITAVSEGKAVITAKLGNETLKIAIDVIA